MQKELNELQTHISASIQNLFKVQFSMSVKVEEKLLQVNKIPPSDCISTVSLSSGDLSGSLSIGFPKATFIKLVKHMLDEEITEITPEVSDASGEVLNIIYASARKPINEMGHNFGLAIPSTVSGHGLHIGKLNCGDNAAVMSCQSELGPFWVTLFLKKSKSNAA